jgi:hypothetical protein
VAGEPVTGAPVIHRHRCMPIYNMEGRRPFGDRNELILFEIF